MGDRILYIEDNLRNRTLVKRVLMIEDFEVDEAETGEAGFTKATTESYDLILMDINLPDIDGYDVTRKLRAAKVQTPIVALTANAMVGDEDKALEAGCDGYITKPVDIDQLPISVRAFIKLGRERAAKASDSTEPVASSANKPNPETKPEATKPQTPPDEPKAAEKSPEEPVKTEKKEPSAAKPADESESTKEKTET